MKLKLLIKVLRHLIMLMGDEPITYSKLIDIVERWQVEYDKYQERLEKQHDDIINEIGD